MKISERFSRLFLTAFLLVLSAVLPVFANENVECWGVFELSLNGPNTGNPFLEVELQAVFKNNSKTVEVSGFYDDE